MEKVPLYNFQQQLKEINISNLLPSIERISSNNIAPDIPENYDIIRIKKKEGLLNLIAEHSSIALDVFNTSDPSFHLFLEFYILSQEDFYSEISNSETLIKPARIIEKLKDFTKM